MYLLKLGLRPWRTAFASQVTSALAAGVLLAIMGLVLSLQQGLRPVLARMQGEQVITAYLDPALGPKEESRVVDQIRLQVGAAPARGGDTGQGAPMIAVKLVDTKAFLTKLQGAYPELGHELEDLGSEMNSMIPRHVTVSGILADSALAAVKGVSGVESAESSKDRFKQVIGAFSTVRWVTTILCLAIAGALLSGLVHLARINAFQHRDATGVLRLLGASAWTLRAPALISGVTVGSVGGAFAAGLWLGGGGWILAHARALSPGLVELPRAGLLMAAAMLFGGSLLGALAGLVGSISLGDERRA